MRSLTLALLLGAASAAAAPEQYVLKTPERVSDTIDRLSGSASKALHDIDEALKGLSGEAGELWEEMNRLFPDAVEKAFSAPPPKPHQRRPDDTWHTITHGHSSSYFFTDMEGNQGIDGNIDQYTLRVKGNEPSSLGADKVKQYSGYLDDNEEDKHLFFWFFESRNDPKHDPVVLWLNGGPGCSSLTGAFMELGPSAVNEKRKLDYNPYSWNSNASVIFLDQPVNVGYSYSSGSVSNTVAASKDVYALLSLFFESYPQYAKQDFHISGESYAGHYIPVFASEILSHKKRNINLKSVLIGNGLTDGYTQYEYYRPMACGEGGYPAVLSESECQSMDNALPRCQSLISSCYDSENVWSCVPASIYCNNALLAPYQRTGTNVYDIRGPCEDSSNLCYKEMGWISDYFNDKSVMDALGAEVSSYESCNFDINRNFLFNGDWMKPYHRLVPGLLEKIPVLIYAGDADFICNWLGNQAWMEALEWPGQKDYNKAEMHNLKLTESSSKIGRYKTSGNFTFVQLFEGGHMVPHDQPEASLEMFNRWISGEWLDV